MEAWREARHGGRQGVYGGKVWMEARHGKRQGMEGDKAWRETRHGERGGKAGRQGERGKAKLDARDEARRRVRRQARNGMMIAHRWRPRPYSWR